AGPDQTLAAGDTLTLSGSESYDPDGTIESYVWDLGELGRKTGETVTEPIPSDAASGVYTVTLIVTDNEGNTDSDTVAITVEGQEEESSLNQPPNANAGEDQNVLLGNYYSSPGEAKILAEVESTLKSSVTVILDGSQSSDDGLNNPLTYTWKLVNSETSIEPQLDNKTLVKPRFILTCETAFSNIDDCTANDLNVTCKYTYALTVFDGEYSDEDNVTITAVYDRSCFPE
ncbi:MAG TPA: PKD domain-containing protein, partial [Epsilonproteobacteria bacterium]|nr:PKD domain-containing protein [Campylobacterota bacterium]